MLFKKNTIAKAVSLSLWALAAPGFAQTTPAPAANLDTVTVTGVRAAMEKSLAVKKAASAIVEVISAEDVGKMPDKNLADSLQRLPGVAVRSDYDEAEKVSMRGTNPDMSLILFNGHTVSGGDWYVSDQLSSSRSTSLSLMPSSVLNEALVYRTSQANLVDGGLAGTINVTTRKPLQQKAKVGGSVSLGASYASLPDKTAGDFNANVNWKNDDNTLGFIVQGFAEKRFVRRDSASRFAYGASSGWDVINTSTMKGITDASLAGTGLKAADLNGVRLPGSMSSEFVEGVRDRKGGMVSVEFKPNSDLDLTLTAFDSSMRANNYGRLTSSAIYSMLLGKNEPLGAVTAAAANTNATGLPGGSQVFAFIKNPVLINETTTWGNELKVLKSADIVFPAGTVPQYVGNSEGFYRDGASATSGFVDLDAKYRVNDDLTVKALLSSTRGVGTTLLDQGVTFARYGTGISYNLNGSTSAPDWSYMGAGTNTPGLNADGSGYKLVGLGASSVRTTDSEQSIALDGEYSLNKGPLSSVEFGVRHADHKRVLDRWAPSRRASALPGAPTTGSLPYPSNFGNTLGGKFDNTGFTYDPETLKAYIASQFKEVSPEFDRRVAGEIDMRERQSALYVMQNLDDGKWSGNVGLRLVRTQINANIVTPTPTGKCPKIVPGSAVVPCVAYPDAINTAGDGSTYYDGAAMTQGAVYFKTATDRTFDHALPSVNVRFEIDKNMLLRAGVSKTIGRQNYNVLGAGFGTPSCTASGCTVTGPNPDLKPLTSNNFDLSWAWYFAPRSLVAVNIFQSNIDGYVKTGAIKQDATVDLIDPADNVIKPFFVNSSSQQGARIRGIDLSYEQPIGKGFGIQGNISRAMTDVDDGRPMVGASEWAGNLGGYFENDQFSVRLVYNYRGAYVASSTAPAPTANSQGLSVINGVTMPVALTWAAPVANVALSMNYYINKNMELAFSATNLLDPARATYRYSEAEPQKLDVSGRQYYLSLKYKL
jgi:iron complex outermembrane receptor protein